MKPQDEKPKIEAKIYKTPIGLQELTPIAQQAPIDIQEEIDFYHSRQNLQTENSVLDRP